MKKHRFTGMIATAVKKHRFTGMLATTVKKHRFTGIIATTVKKHGFTAKIPDSDNCEEAQIHKKYSCYNYWEEARIHMEDSL